MRYIVYFSTKPALNWRTKKDAVFGTLKEANEFVEEMSRYTSGYYIVDNIKEKTNEKRDKTSGKILAA